MPGTFLADRRLQVGWGTFSFAISMWLWGQKMYLLPAGPKEGSLPPQVYSAHWCVLGLLQADAELCLGSLQAALTSPKASGRAPHHVCNTHRGSRGRLLMCKSMSWVSCSSRGWPLGWVLLAVSVPQVLCLRFCTTVNKAVMEGSTGWKTLQGLGVPKQFPLH